MDVQTEVVQANSWERTGKLVTLSDLLKVNAHSFAKALATCSEMRGIAWAISKSEGGSFETPELFKDAEALCDELSAMGLRIALKAAERFKESIRGKTKYTQQDANDVSSDLDAIISRISDEMEDRVFLALTEDERKHYGDPEPFGSFVSSTFPNARDDIEDAAKCLALERGTACVFHLMCALEPVLHAFSGKLRVVYDPTWDWNTALDKTIKPINAMPTGTSNEIQMKEEYLAAHAQLHAVRRAWRNPSLHARRRYTPEEALEVFNAVKSFMRDVAKVV